MTLFILHPYLFFFTLWEKQHAHAAQNCALAATSAPVARSVIVEGKSMCCTFKTTHYRKVSGTIFALIAVLHLARLLYGWEAVIGGWTVPVWASVLGVIIAGWLAWSAFQKETA